MTIQYSIIQDTDVLLVKARGYDEDLREVVAYYQAIKQQAEARRCRRILCDERELEYRLSITETYTLGKCVAQVAVLRPQIAIVTVESNREVARFWETVIRNRGIRVGVFYELAAARKWLSRTGSSKERARLEPGG